MNFSAFLPVLEATRDALGAGELSYAQECLAEAIRINPDDFYGSGPIKNATRSGAAKMARSVRSAADKPGKSQWWHQHQKAALYRQAGAHKKADDLYKKAHANTVDAKTEAAWADKQLQAATKQKVGALKMRADLYRRAVSGKASAEDGKVADEMKLGVAGREGGTGSDRDQDPQPIARLKLIKRPAPAPKKEGADVPTHFSFKSVAADPKKPKAPKADEPSKISFKSVLHSGAKVERRKR